ncbi:MAG: hypothetical protein WKF61_04540 [Luteimonas sp.]
MKRPHKFLILFTGIILIVGILLLFQRESYVPPLHEAKSRPVSDSVVITARNAPVGPVDRKLSVKHPFPGVPTTRVGLPLKGDPFLATSKAEQLWLDRNGYPNAEQWEIYSQASDSLLATAADSGDSVAKVMLNIRRLTAGDMSATQELLATGANGSSFALEMLSSFMAGSSKGDPMTGYALSRVVEMRGNYRVAMGRDVMFAKHLNPVQRMEAEGKAMEIFNAMKKNRKGGGFIDPRPIDGQ